MNRRMLWTLAASLLLLLAGCGSSTVNDPVEPVDPPGEDSMFEPIDPETDIPGNEGEAEPEEPIDENTETPDLDAIPTSLLDYFPDGDTSAYYKGEGNEFAQLENTISRPAPDYVVIHENNGGSYIQKVYKQSGDKIQLMKEEPVDLDVIMPTAAELDAMTPIRAYLQGPIAVGTTFDDWTIIETDASLQTPMQSFDDVVVLEQVDGDNTNRVYLAEGYGEVKRESIMSVDGEPDFVVTSTLENMTQP